MAGVFAALGLADDADERAVKRAYAQRLKQVRPDSDPAGFQRLHEAYQAALALARSRAPRASPASRGDAAPASVPTPSAEADTSTASATSSASGPALEPDASAPPPSAHDAGTPNSRPAAVVRLRFDDPPAAPIPLSPPPHPVRIDTDEPAAPADSAHDSAPDLVRIGADDAPMPPPAAPAIRRLGDEESTPAAVAPPSRYLRFDDEPKPTAAVPPQRDLPAAPPVFHFERFYTRFLRHAAAGDAAALRQWLATQPELWSLQHKSVAGPALLSRLQREPAPVNAACFDAALEFFDLDRVHAARDPLQLLRLRAVLQTHWDFAADDDAELARRLHASHPDIGIHHSYLVRLLGLLTQPLRWRRALPHTLVPGRVGDMRRIAHGLFGPNPGALPPRFDARAVRFWLRAGERSAYTRERTGVLLFQCLALTLAITALGLAGPAVDGRAGLVALPIAALCGLGLSLLALGFHTWRFLAWWQGLPEFPTSPARARWRWAFLPVLALASVLLGRLVSPGVGAPLGVLALSLAIPRWRLRSGRGPVQWSSNLLARLGGLYFGMMALSLVVAVPEAGLGLTGLFWGLDAWREWCAARRR